MQTNIILSKLFISLSETWISNQISIRLVLTSHHSNARILVRGRGCYSMLLTIKDIDQAAFDHVKVCPQPFLTWPQRQLGHGHQATLSVIVSNEQTRTKMSAMVCNHCGVGKISRHCGVGLGSVLFWPFFLTKTLIVFVFDLLDKILKDIKNTLSLRLVGGYENNC